MPRRSRDERIHRAVAACGPKTQTGQMLLDRYLQGVDLNRPIATADHEVWNLYEVCRVVERFSLDSLTMAAFEQAIADAPTPTARKRRRLVIGRLIRLLEEDGFPPAADRRASARIKEALAPLPEDNRAILARWLKQREGEGVGWHELSYEARRLVGLELLAAERADLEDAVLVNRWIGQMVKQVVDCGDPPVTRRRDPLHCSSCGATAETTKTRPSPCPRKQKELEAIGRRYLAVRTHPQPPRQQGETA